MATVPRMIYHPSVTSATAAAAATAKAVLSVNWLWLWFGCRCGCTKIRFLVFRNQTRSDRHVVVLVVVVHLRRGRIFAIFGNDRQRGRHCRVQAQHGEGRSEHRRGLTGPIAIINHVHVFGGILRQSEDRLERGFRVRLFRNNRRRLGMRNEKMSSKANGAIEPVIHSPCIRWPSIYSTVGWIQRRRHNDGLPQS